jgi:hypothetical protein
MLDLMIPTHGRGFVGAIATLGARCHERLMADQPKGWLGEYALWLAVTNFAVATPRPSASVAQW